MAKTVDESLFSIFLYQSIKPVASAYDPAEHIEHVETPAQTNDCFGFAPKECINAHSVVQTHASLNQSR